MPEHQTTHDLDLQVFRPLTALEVFCLAELMEAHAHELLDGEQLSLEAAYEPCWVHVALSIERRCGRALDWRTVRRVAASVLRSKPTIHDGVAEKYSLFVQAFPASWFQFMNYGYVGPGGAPDDHLSDLERHWLPCVNLYHRVAACLPRGISSLLEVGCGRGGGAAYLWRALRADRVLGADLSSSNVAFCRRTHSASGLSFTQADACTLAGIVGPFDAIVSVESFRYYASLSGFADSVRRVMSARGCLALAGFGSEADADQMIQEVREAGFRVRTSVDISAGVRAAFDWWREGGLERLLASNASLHEATEYMRFLGAIYDGAAVMRTGVVYLIVAFEPTC